MDTSKRRHVAILSSPGMGHLIPVLVLGNRLGTHHNVKVTVLVITTLSSPPGSQGLNFPVAAKKLLDIVQLPPVDISHLINPSTKIATQLFMAVQEALPSVKSAIAGMKHRPDALIVDLFGTGAFPIAEEFNMPKYVYIPSNAWFTAVTLYLPVLDREIEGQYVDQVEPFKIPGCRPVRPEDVVDPMLDRNDEQYRWYARQGVEFGLSDGILMNTWEGLDHKSLQARREDETLRTAVKVPPVYAIGPLRRPAEPAGTTSKSHVIDWLNMQPHDSVMYVSFGSGGSLSTQQTIELACGLEMSQQRFLWVIRPPIDGDADKSYLSSIEICSSNGTPNYLPEGFLTRTRKVGLVVPTWVPQVEILNHPSVAGFLSHCGWNSTLEGIAGGGVPLIAWPLHAEQRLNATLLAEELGVAVRPEVLPGKRVVKREEIEKLVRRVMQEKEGMALRDKVGKLKATAEAALSKGGTSYNSMLVVLNDIERRLSSNSKLIVPGYGKHAFVC